MKNMLIPSVVSIALLFPWVMAKDSLVVKKEESIDVQNGEGGDRYAPGLGEIMTLTQMRHAKLWFAGKAENWKLAEYEVKELQEGFDDAVKYHPDRSALLAEMTAESMKLLQRAIVKKDEGEFEKAYKVLTISCNACHEATDFGFNKVITPSRNPFPNQDFKAH
jgi:hypothetical protein